MHIQVAKQLMIDRKTPQLHHWGRLALFYNID
jgi:hypothetical protein